MTVVCIAGMHRSGTSMVAKLLSQCGIYLGGEEDLMPRDNYNVDGYWENLGFVEINDSLLSYFSGTWSLPPTSDITFDISQIPEALTRKAQSLIQRFEGKSFWGWKDPRNSITLPFWQQLIPNLKFIVCLRNPLEVAQSLFSRDNFPMLVSFDLWYTYNVRLLYNTSPENRLITSYNAYFINSQSELQRMLEFIDLLPEKNAVQAACKAATVSLRHNFATFENLVAAGAPLETINLYIEMSKQAQTPSWNIFSVPKKNNTMPIINNNDFEHNLIHNLTQNDSVTQTLIAYLSKKEQEMETIVAEKEQALEILTTQLHMKQSELLSIYNSRAWHLVSILRRIRQVIAH